MAKLGVRPKRETMGFIFPISLLGISASLVTLAITPNFNFDPINMPKMFLLSMCSLSFCPILFQKRASLNKIALVAVGIIIVAMFVSSFVSQQPWQSQLWGTFGRSTGILTYTGLFIFLLAASLLRDIGSQNSVLQVFIKLSYLITGYTQLQYLELDPFPWSQKLPIATLGNINFMSGFLGLACIALLGRILQKQATMSSRIFFAIVIAWNTMLIWNSGSIQGLVVFAAGMHILVIGKLLSFGLRLQASLTFFLIAVLGFFLALGSAGMGPLSSFAKQDTVLYRIDYWTAGVKMFLSNPLFGVGIDQYGDFYREYRSQLAVERTGPYRVANTAHNVFLDLLSGGGILVGGTFFILVVVVLLVGLMKLGRKSQLDSNLPILLALMIGYFAFCLISINQIGVAVWGFIFIGLTIASLLGHSQISRVEVAQGRVRQSVGNLQSENIAKGSVIKLGNKFGVLGFLSALLGLAIAVGPMTVDVRFNALVKSATSFESARSFLNRDGVDDFYVEKYMDSLIQKGLVKEAFNLARELSERNPRNFNAWASIYQSSIATIEDKLEAASALKALDPNNVAMVDELNQWMQMNGLKSK